ncbi:hypothetical protein KY312_01165, partial [Candidatus Woesearchaeota archaeon]|nr:hypothetical protein [Candidatus Woesearchaeota archaeon]
MKLHHILFAAALALGCSEKPIEPVEKPAVEKNYKIINNLPESKKHLVNNSELEDVVEELKGNVVQFDDVMESVVFAQKKYPELDKVIKIISAGQEYWKHPRLPKPQYIIAVYTNLKKKWKLDLPITLEICPVEKFQRTYAGKSDGKDFSISMDYAKETYRSYEMSVPKKAGGAIRIKYLMSPIIWPLNKERKEVLQLPSKQILRTQVGCITDSVAGKVWNSRIRKEKLRGKQLVDLHRKLIFHYSIYEREFVDALHELFFHDYVKQHPEINIQPAEL